MRRLIAAAIALGLALGSGTAVADSTPNDHNCAGTFSSGVTPEFTAGGGFGAGVATDAQNGTRDDSIQVLVELFANCGAAR